MGLKHSGFVASLAFYYNVERSFVHSLQQHGIISYTRFFDDICFVFVSRESMLTFMPKFRASVHSYFTILIAAVSRSSVEFLDLTITIEGGKLRVDPTLNKIPTPLCPTSAHEPSVHRSWPKAVAQRVQELSQDPATSLAKLRSNSVKANVHPWTLAKLELPAF